MRSSAEMSSAGGEGAAAGGEGAAAGVDRSAAAPHEAGYDEKVPAVDQATRILYYLAAEPRGHATLTEICREVGIYKSKGRAILNTLRAAALVTRADPEKTYSLGPGLLALSRAVLDRTDLASAATPFLEKLAVDPGTCAFVALIRGPQVYVVARREAPGGVSVTIRVGYQYPLTWGSMGKAILAFLPEPERETLLAGSDLFLYGDTKGKAIDLDAARRELEVCSRLGYCTDLGHIQPGLQAASAPLLGGRVIRRPVGVVTVFGTFPPEEIAVHGERVAATAREMSDRLSLLLDGMV